LSNAFQVLNAIGMATDMRISSVLGDCQERLCIDAA